GTLATPDPSALPSDAGPFTTWDKLKSKGSEKSDLPVDDEGTVDPDKGGKLKTKDGWLSVEFPPGAVTETVKLKYKRAGNAPHPVLDSRDTYFAFGLEAETSSGQKVTKFTQPITITVSYQDGSGIDAGAGMFYWNEEGGFWAFVPSTQDLKARTIVATPDHLTDYSISDANQIEPDLPSLKGYQMDLQTGAATVNYPIDVPPGINGLQPRLSLGYNSQNKTARAGKYDQASTVGWDWTLGGIPYIIQTKQNTTAGMGIIYTLVMDGIGGELVKTGTTDDSWRTSNESVTKVLRIYDPPQRGWVITTKDGTQYKLEDPWNYDATRGINYLDYGTGCNDYIWRFSTTVITDTLGNTMAFSYDRDTGTTSCRGTTYDITKAVYPTQILYAGGKYKVELVYSDPATPRQDRYGAGTQQQAKRMLDEIRVWDLAPEPDRLIRKYALSHGYFTTKDDTGTAYTRLALNSITPYGDGGTAALPSVSFTYVLEKYLVGTLTHPPQLQLLSQASNGYGGTAQYVYEDIPDNYPGSHIWHERVNERGERDGLGSVYTYTYSYGPARKNSKSVSEEQASQDLGN
ncbi:MAG: hypothetical protein M1582_00035, partial [Actinobacteria bacterium]|nr:hypothetical protein [Actinomycetota bacterium]